MQIEIGVFIQIVILIAGVGASYATIRSRSSHDEEQRKVMSERIASLEQRTLSLLSKSDAEEHYLTKLEFNLTMRNVDDKLGHIEANQSDILKILRGAEHG